jgi:hypothetical protein
MKAFFLALTIILIYNTQLLAVDKEEIRLALDFERMKLRSDYTRDLEKLTKEGQLIVVWVSYEDTKLYKWLKVQYPDIVHCFVESSDFVDVQPGIVVGIRRKGQVEQAKALSVSALKTLKTEGVISYSLGLPPGSLAVIHPSSGQGTPEESCWKH